MDAIPVQACRASTRMVSRTIACGPATYASQSPYGMYRAATRPTFPCMPSKAGSSDVTGMTWKPW